MSQRLWKAPEQIENEKCKQVRPTCSAIGGCSNRLGTLEGELLAFIFNALEAVHFIFASSQAAPSFLFIGIVSPKFICWGLHRHCSEKRSKYIYDIWFFLSLGDASTERHLFWQPINQCIPLSAKTITTFHIKERYSVIKGNWGKKE